MDIGSDCAKNGNNNKDCEEWDTTYKTLRNRDQPSDTFKSIAASLEKRFNEGKESYYDAIKNRNQIWNSSSMDLLFVFVVVSCLLLISMLSANITPPILHSYTNYFFLFGFFTVFMIIWYLTMPLPIKSKETMFQIIMNGCRTRIQERQMYMQAYKLYEYGDKAKLTFKKYKDKEIDDEDIQEKELWENVSGFPAKLKWLWEMRNIKNIDYMYWYYTISNIIFITCFLVLFFYTVYYRAPWFAIFYYPIIVFIYFYHLTHWVTLFDVYSNSKEESEAREDSEKKGKFFVFSNLNWIFVLVNSLILIISLIIFITFLFKNDSLASWTMFSFLGFIFAMTYVMLEGDTMTEKLTKFKEMREKHFLHLTSLIIYMLFFVFFFVTPTNKMPKPALWLYSLLDTLTGNNSTFQSLYAYIVSPVLTNQSFVDNVYSFIFFPVFIMYGILCFYRATFPKLVIENADINYNAIRIRYFIIYFLLFVFFVTLRFHQHKIPCYVQKLFIPSFPHTRAIFNCIIIMFVFGFIS